LHVKNYKPKKTLQIQKTCQKPWHTMHLQNHMYRATFTGAQKAWSYNSLFCIHLSRIQNRKKPNTLCLKDPGRFVTLLDDENTFIFTTDVQFTIFDTASEQFLHRSLKVQDIWCVVKLAGYRFALSFGGRVEVRLWATLFPQHGKSILMQLRRYGLKMTSVTKYWSSKLTW
jgi:hypothetical protein